ncbi:MAG: zinc ribbon domain-containing protein [Chloroflexi bacterium]|nr:zinc ribbon domain-containing protein [Chloroflexota bacterium]
MEISAILIGMGMLGISIPFVISPFRQKHLKNNKKSDTRAQNEERRVAVLSALRDLDFDYKIGKVSDEDYVPVRAGLVAEAAQTIQQQDEEDKRLETLIQARRASRGLKCEQCGSSVEAGNHFCPKCGTPVNSGVCPSCGKNVRADDLFCPSCGGRLEVQMEAAGQS